MRNRKPTDADKISLLKNEIKNKRSFMACKTPHDQEKDKEWIKKSEAKIASFYAPATL